jgi:hypothetical protein
LKLSKILVVASIFVFIPFVFFNSTKTLQSTMNVYNNKTGSGRVYLKTMAYFKNNKDFNLNPMFSNNIYFTKFYTNSTSNSLPKKIETLNKYDTFYVMLFKKIKNDKKSGILSKIQDKYNIDTIVKLQDVNLLRYEKK